MRGPVKPQRPATRQALPKDRHGNAYPPMAGHHVYPLELTAEEIRMLDRWRKRVGVVTSVKAIKLLLRIGLKVADFPPYGSPDERGEPFQMRLPTEISSSLLEAARRSGRSMRNEMFHRLEQSLAADHKTEKGEAPA